MEGDPFDAPGGAVPPDEAAPSLDPAIDESLDLPEQELPRGLIEFQIKYLSGLRAAYLNSFDTRDKGGPMDVQRPTFEDFQLGMGSRGFNSQEMTRLWNNYMGEHPWRQVINGDMSRDIERYERLLDEVTNDEPWDPPQLMDWGFERDSFGDLVGDPDPGELREALQRYADQMNQQDLRNPLWDRLSSRLAADVDPVEALDHALRETEEQASLLVEGADPSTWTEAEIREFIDQQSLPAEGTDPAEALAHELEEQEAGQSLLTDHELEEVREQQSLLTGDQVADQEEDLAAQLDHAMAEEEAQQSLPDPEETYTSEPDAATSELDDGTSDMTDDGGFETSE